MESTLLINEIELLLANSDLKGIVNSSAVSAQKKKQLLQVSADNTD